MTKNTKRFIAGASVALAIGLFSVAGPINVGQASADGPGKYRVLASCATTSVQLGGGKLAPLKYSDPIADWVDAGCPND